MWSWSARFWFTQSTFRASGRCKRFNRIDMWTLFRVNFVFIPDVVANGLLNALVSLEPENSLRYRNVGNYDCTVIKKTREKKMDGQCNVKLLNFFYVFYSTLLHLPPLRSHYVGVWGCWDRNQDCCDFGIGKQTPGPFGYISQESQELFIVNYKLYNDDS